MILKLDLPGSVFQKRVWKELIKIPYGTTISYLEPAQKPRNIKLVRAVAGANAQNKLYILIPCHRVLASNGKITGYGGGIKRKNQLLNFEFEHICHADRVD